MFVHTRAHVPRMEWYMEVGNTIEKDEAIHPSKGLCVRTANIFGIFSARVNGRTRETRGINSSEDSGH